MALHDNNNLIKELLREYANSCPELFNYYSDLLKSNHWETDSYFVKKDNKDKVVSIRLLAEI